MFDENTCPLRASEEGLTATKDYIALSLRADRRPLAKKSVKYAG